MDKGGKRTCQVVRPGGAYDGKQRLSYFEGIAKLPQFKPRSPGCLIVRPCGAR